jgi:hypothetical protein
MVLGVRACGFLMRKWLRVIVQVIGPKLEKLSSLRVPLPYPPSEGPAGRGVRKKCLQILDYK